MWILEWRLFRAVNHSQKLFPAGNERKIFSHSFVNISKYRWPGASGPGNVEGLPGSLGDGRAALWPRAQWCWAASGSRGHIGPAVTSPGADLIAVLVELMARARSSSCFPPLFPFYFDVWVFSPLLLQTLFHAYIRLYCWKSAHS